MEQRAIDFLRRLLDAPGPSGYEQPPAKLWRTEAEAFADDVGRDVTGNSYARLRNEGGPKVIVAGHVDEIGFVITDVDPEGFLWFAPIGGWDDQVVIGQRLRIAGRGGDVVGVIGKKAAHLLRKEDRERPTELRDLWIDIGAKDRADARTCVDVGDPAVIDAAFVQLTDDLCAARSMDNRVGAFVALEAARRLAQDRPAADLYAVATSQEETSFAGAFTASFQLAPRVAIAVDVTHATDYPGVDKRRHGDYRLGGGPVLSRGASVSEVVFELLAATAEAEGIPYSIEAASRDTRTDAEAIFNAHRGVATALVSVPNRYMHSPNEMIALEDLDRTARLLAAFARRLTRDTDFVPR